MPDLLPLNTTLGRYYLTDVIGSGGMGQVYRARRLDTGEFVALKALSPEAYSSPTGIARFRNEAIIQYNLQHPSIARLYEYLDIAGRPPCIVMEYVDGLNLDDYLHQNGPLNPALALEYFKALTVAMSYIHSCGVIHRDLKATNVKITTAGQVKILDFGIAHEEHISGLTRVGYVIGTLENLAPEQTMGGKGDVRSDIWALGVLLYQMLTGRMPFEAGQPDQLTAKIVYGTYIPPNNLVSSAIPGALTRIVDRCLKKKPADRYQNTAELLTAIDRAIAGAKPWAPVLEFCRSVARKPLALVGAAVLLLALLVWCFWPSSRVPPPGPLAEEQLPAVQTPPTEPPKVPTPPLADKQPPKQQAGGEPAGAKTDAPRPGAAVEDPYLRNPATQSTPPEPQPVRPPPPVVPPPVAPKPVVETPRLVIPAGRQLVLRVEVFEGPATVYMDGLRIPGTTPNSFQAVSGQQMTLTLKMPGYQDLTTRITAGDRLDRLYQFHMGK